MTAALVRRPRRKMHLGTLHGADWWTVCDRIVPADGAAVTQLQDAVGTIDAQSGVVCVDCHRIILMAGVVHQLGIGQLVASLDVAA